MDTLVIETPRLRLLVESTENVLARLDAMSAADRAEVSPDWIAQLRANPPSAWTHGFAAVERATGASVGSCAFKGPPDEDGTVEIAYGVDANYRGRGYAKEMAAALTTYALGEGRASLVRAHTLPANNASTRVLISCGFKHIGEVMDPEDGLVWRWERA
jgi:RimJ/RimL family protein N-acetyltransferase